MKNKKLSAFVVPVYIYDEKQLSFLEETIVGMLNQSDDMWEAIFINDNSECVGVEELLKKYKKIDSRIHSILLNKRISTGNCRNMGIEWANQNSAEIILYNDADDISHKRRVETVKRIFDEEKDCVVVYSGFEVIDESNKKVPFKNLATPIQEVIEAVERYHPEGDRCWIKFGLYTGYTNITSSTAVRTKLAKLEPFPDEYVSEDMHTWLRYALYGSFRYDSSIPTQYRIPSYANRQTSNQYVNDFNATKVRVDENGFSKTLDLAVEKKIITEENKVFLKLGFLLRLSQSMLEVERIDLAIPLIERVKCNLNMLLPD